MNFYETKWLYHLPTVHIETHQFSYSVYK